MAYAILRHQVFDIHVIIRLGLRYAAARGVCFRLFQPRPWCSRSTYRFTETSQ